MASNPGKPAPLELGPGEQQDDNIDDAGNKTDGSKHEQPTKKPAPKSDR